jgi:hypothetical protein
VYELGQGTHHGIAVTSVMPEEIVAAARKANKTLYLGSGPDFL